MNTSTKRAYKRARVEQIQNSYPNREDFKTREAYRVACLERNLKIMGKLEE